ncbi:hypothetical protein [Leptospira noumeaensis]|uniref:hypothetical protein n=1 Tax=Leptospira noumeaensis TaxID=2484964 RepID=UPI001ABF826A|nr:hypothetical protein [Leptospira noumeaensis]
MNQEMSGIYEQKNFQVITIATITCLSLVGASCGKSEDSNSGKAISAVSDDKPFHQNLNDPQLATRALINIFAPFTF